MTRAWDRLGHILSSNPGEAPKRIRKRVIVRRRNHQDLARLATAVPSYRGFARLIAWLLAATVLMLAVGFGLFEFNWADSIRDFLQQVVPR